MHWEWERVRARREWWKLLNKKRRRGNERGKNQQRLSEGIQGRYFRKVRLLYNQRWRKFFLPRLLSFQKTDSFFGKATKELWEKLKMSVWLNMSQMRSVITGSLNDIPLTNVHVYHCLRSSVHWLKQLTGYFKEYCFISELQTGLVQVWLQKPASKA